MPNKNPNCDGANCAYPDGPVRLLPLGKLDGSDGSIIVCFACYLHEKHYRIRCNIDLRPENRFDIPEWNSLRMYPEPEEFWLEDKISGGGEAFTGDFKSAMQRAFDMCVSPSTVVCVWTHPDNEKVAEQTLQGAKWVHEQFRNEVLK